MFLTAAILFPHIVGLDLKSTLRL